MRLGDGDPISEVVVLADDARNDGLNQPIGVCGGLEQTEATLRGELQLYRVGGVLRVMEHIVCAHLVQLCLRAGGFEVEQKILIEMNQAADVEFTAMLPHPWTGDLGGGYGG